MLARLRRRLSRLLEAPEPQERYGPFESEAEAREHSKGLSRYWSGHLNAYDGFFEVAEEPDGEWWVWERRGRREPRKRWLSNLLAYTPNP